MAIPLTPLAHTSDERVDNSLQGKALRRAKQNDVPRTLTPYEWEQWYAAHGVPENHRAEPAETSRRKWWHFWRHF